MQDVIQLGDAVIVHPDTIREVYVNDNKLIVITEDTSHEMECECNAQAMAFFEKVKNYLNVIEEL